MNRRPAYLGYIAMSLDGFIADTAGSVAWLDPFNAALADAGDDGGYGDFIAGIDALLMGRKTYDQVTGWGWPYGERPGFVLTRDPGFAGDHVQAAGDIGMLQTAIETAGHQKVWVLGGGEAQRAALDTGLFDELRIFVMPTLLGGGRPLFTPGAQHNLALQGLTKRPGGIVELNYRIKD